MLLFTMVIYTYAYAEYFMRNICVRNRVRSDVSGSDLNPALPVI